MRTWAQSTPAYKRQAQSEASRHPQYMSAEGERLPRQSPRCLQVVETRPTSSFRHPTRRYIPHSGGLIMNMNQSHRTAAPNTGLLQRRETLSISPRKVTISSGAAERLEAEEEAAGGRTPRGGSSLPAVLHARPAAEIPKPVQAGTPLNNLGGSNGLCLTAPRTDTKNKTLIAPVL